MTSDAMQLVLDHLDGVVPDGEGKWRALCPSHDDHDPSLSVRVGDTQPVVLKCMVGCENDDVVRAMGLTWRDIFGASENGKKGRRWENILATYDYHDSDGKLLFQVCRTASKTFLQRRPDGDGHWVWGLNDGEYVQRADGDWYRPRKGETGGTRRPFPRQKRVLYRMPQLVASKKSDATVYLVEGEKDADRLRKEGLVATCNPGRAGKWRFVDDSPLAGQRVVPIPDNDGPGRTHVEEVAAALYGKATSIKVLGPLVEKRGGDVSDWLDAGGDVEDLDRLAADATEWEPVEDDRVDGHNLTDHGNIGLTRQLAEAVLRDERFAQDVGGALYHFAGGVYKPQGEQRVKRRVKSILTEWDLSTKWTTHRAAEVIEYIRVDVPPLWERPPQDTINVLNGLLDVNNRDLRPHDPAFMSPIQLPVEYDPAATCPAWDQFVSETFPEDARLVAFEIPADIMTPGKRQTAVLALGEGANGKGVYMAGVTAFIGRRNIAAVPLHRLESDRCATARLVGKLANVCPDLPSEHLTSTSVFKGLTGGDVMLAERKFAESFEFVPFARLIFSANHPPRSADASHAFFRRWLVIPFPRTFEPDEQTPRDKLDAKLANPAELSGVLNKALDALPRLRSEGFTEAPSMRKAWDEFRQTTDPLTVWLEHSTVQTSDAIVPKDDLRKAYNRHADNAGCPTMTAHAMTKAINRAYPDVAEAQRTVHGRAKTWCWIGLGLAAKE